MFHHTFDKDYPRLEVITKQIDFAEEKILERIKKILEMEYFSS
jgi:hypothetical protein